MYIRLTMQKSNYIMQIQRVIIRISIKVAQSQAHTSYQVIIRYTYTTDTVYEEKGHNWDTPLTMIHT